MKRSELARKPTATKVYTCSVCRELFRRSPKWRPSNPQGIVRCARCNQLARRILAQTADYTPIPVIDNAGTKHGNYRHGRRVGANISKPAVRRAVTERDGAWCLLCGRPGPGLHLHRVKYGSEGGEYEVGNCVLLCGADHALVHSSKRTWKPLLLEYLDGGQMPTALAQLRQRLETR